MKNICFLNSTTFWGGGEKIHYDYALKFKSRGYHVIMAAAADFPLYERAGKAGLELLDVRFGNLSFLNPLAYFKLITFYKKEKIDTVIFSSSHDVKVGALAAKAAGVKNIVYYRALAVPVKNNPLNRYLYTRVLTHVIANSLETRRTMVQNMSEVVSLSSIGVVYQGLPIAEMDLLPVLPLWEREEGVFYIGNAGRLTAQKGQRYLITIAQYLQRKNIRFKIKIAGDGELYEELKAEIKKYKLQDEVELLGFVKDVNSFMHGLDVFVLTSEWEGFGYVLAEAMLAQKPVIAFDMTSNPELIDSGKNGYLIPFPNVELFADKIADLADHPELRKQFGQHGRQKIKDSFELNKVISDMENYILNNKKSDS
jgi:glycosyltransferase involved in cell wall biosynthesis